MAAGNLDYPLEFRGDLSQPPGRGLWLIKWLLIIPHLFVLFFLAFAFFVSWIICFFAILFTKKYPKGLFDFNVGFIRWWWRVVFYAYSALGTDKYPPFSLDPDPDYPADLSVTYPEELSRGLVLVKWWLLAIPHYIIVGIFAGGNESIGLIGVLVIIVAIVLLFTGKYPDSLFKLIIALNRWVYRVAIYAALMTDKYPPFSLEGI